MRNCPRENPVNFDGGERNFRVRSVAAAAAAAGAGERASFIALLAIVCVLATLSPLFPEISISSGAVARELGEASLVSFALSVSVCAREWRRGAN